jgi:hypothetical protein
MHQRVTKTSGNSRNRIRGSRITVWTADGDIVDRFEVPSRWGVQYCQKHPKGRYGARYAAALKKAQQIDVTRNSQQNPGV